MNNAATRKLERRRPEQMRGRRTKQKVLAAAHSILIRDGVKSLTTRSLAKEAGLSVGSVYQYFPNKQAVLFWVYEKRMKERLEVFDRVWSQREQEQLDASTFFFRYLEALREARMWSKLDLELGYAEERDEELRKYTESFHKELSCRYVKAWKQAGSNWTEDNLLLLTRYLHELDQVNRKLQQGESKHNRAFFGALTTEVFRYLNYMTGSMGAENTSVPFDFTGNVEQATRQVKKKRKP